MNDNSRVLLIGHRGAAAEAFENTLSGFQLALDLGLDGIELDIRYHQGELWVIHDQEVDRLTYHEGLFEDFNPESIRLRNGASIPTLRQVLDLLWGKIPVNIEIKTPDTVTPLLELLSEYPSLPAKQDLPWIMISSFDHQQLLEIKHLQTPWPVAPITLGLAINSLEIINQLQPYSWHMDDEYLDKQTISMIKKQNVRVFVYTVNKPASLSRLIDFGVEGIFTDKPSTFKSLD